MAPSNGQSYSQEYPPAYGSLTIQVPFSVHGACFLLKDDATESTKYARSKELFYLFIQTFDEKSLGEQCGGGGSVADFARLK